MVGIEPTTYGLRNRCSTTELHWLGRAEIAFVLQMGILSRRVCLARPLIRFKTPYPSHPLQAQRRSFCEGSGHWQVNSPLARNAGPPCCQARTLQLPLRPVLPWQATRRSRKTGGRRRDVPREIATCALASAQPGPMVVLLLTADWSALHGASWAANWRRSRADNLRISCEEEITTFDVNGCEKGEDVTHDNCGTGSS